MLQQAFGCLGLNGQCTVPNLKQLFVYLDLSPSGPKVELMQRVYNHTDSVRMYMGLPTDIALCMRSPWLGTPKAKMKALIVDVLSGAASEGNDIRICEGAHSTTVGWHRLCLTPPLHEVPAGSWLCPKCVSARSGLGRGTTEASATLVLPPTPTLAQAPTQTLALPPTVRLTVTSTLTLTPTLTVTIRRSCGSHGRPWWGATHV